MSIDPRMSAKAAAKRRADARRRRRELLRQLGAIFFVVIFVLGTATTIFVAQTSAPTSTSDLPVATVQPTEAAGAGAQQLVQQAEQAEAKQDWNAASSYYLAALGLSSGNATLHYKLGKALINKGDYAKAVENLQKAVDLNPSAAFAAEAQSLINEYKGKTAPAGITTTLTVPSTIVTGTSPVTGSTTVTK